ncbi:MAG TPA: hypothetical protein VN633_20885 [Bryobacteraceae bacterium]|nr:hypothetical protein [Bryobacteraceae bacterium]
MPIFQFVLSLFAAKPKDVPAQDVLTATTLGNNLSSHPGLNALSAGLERAGKLLLAPDPQSIQAATLIVNDMNAQMKSMNTAEFGEENWHELRNVHQQLKRVRNLLDGAMRIQWTVLRRLTAVTQSYAPPGKVSQFKDRWPRVDVKV